MMKYEKTELFLSPVDDKYLMKTWEQARENTKAKRTRSLVTGAGAALMTAGVVAVVMIGSQRREGGTSNQTVHGDLTAEIDIDEKEKSPSEALQTLPTALGGEAAQMEQISLQKYNNLIKFWCGNTRLADEAVAEYPDFYGGAYLDEKHSLVLLVTSDEDAATAYFSDLIDMENVSVKTVQYNYRTLLAEQARIASLIPTFEGEAIKRITGVGIDVKGNAVALYVETDYANDADLLENEVAEKISRFGRITIIVKNQKDTVE